MRSMRLTGLSSSSSTRESFSPTGFVTLSASIVWTLPDRQPQGNEIARQFGMVDGALVTIGDSVAGMLQQLDGATRADTGGKFWDNEGAQLQW